MQNGESVEGQLIRYGIEVGLLISGFFGALMMVSKDASRRLGGTVAALLAGTACANYLTPVVLGMMPETVRSQGRYAAAFMMGFMGLKGLEMLIERFVKEKGSRGGKKRRAAARRRG